ncbi:MAG: sulfotransferase domain-containing protein [Novosphingobium sp.]|nr:sulfotransferase domain-containing protein [Novosphingobium sp.]
MTAEAKPFIDDSMLLHPHEGRYQPSVGMIAYMHEGVPYPPAGSASLFEAIEGLPLDPADLTIVGYPKSGTNWLQVIVSRLYDDDFETLRRTGGIVPHVDMGSRPGFHGFESVVDCPSPRLMKAHCSVDRLPRAFRENRVSKVICVIRNGKDVCDSYYNQFSTMREQMQFTLDWPEFFDHFMAGMVPYGSWRDHTLRWRQFGEAEGVLHLEFETMRRNTGETLERIASFVGRPLAKGAIERVIAETEFSAMQKGDMAKRYNGEVARRAGGIGSWKQHFTVAQNERFDAEFVRPLEAAGISLQYE